MQGDPCRKERVARIIRRHSVQAALLLAILIAVAVPTSGQTQGEVGSYRLSPGDRLTVTVFGQAELSGDFMVDGAGGVQIPLLGEVPVQDLTIKEVERQIATRLSDGFLQHPIVNVRMGEFRPISVLGDVRTPGSYPYRYGTTVLGAVSLAGGFGIGAAVGTTARADFLLADERVRVLQTTRRGLIARVARLEAQRDGKVDFHLPASFDEKADPQLTRLANQERETLKAESKAYHEELALQQDQKPRLEAEIKGIKDQSEYENVQLKLIQVHLEDYNKLLVNGLARKYTGIELQREEARNRGNIARFASELARLEVTIGEIDIKIQSAEAIYARRVATELQEARTRLQEIETTMPLAREVRAARLQSSTGLEAKDGRQIFVMRTYKGETKTLPATETTALFPGDIVEVRTAAPSDSMGSSAMSTGASMSEDGTVATRELGANTTSLTR